MSKEKPLTLTNGYAMLAAVIFAFVCSVAVFIGGAALVGPLGGWAMAGAGVIFIVAIIACNGFLTFVAERRVSVPCWLLRRNHQRKRLCGRTPSW